ncbi:YifB family Mg chelatase-like AAA ATPase [Candidatus Bipolaricaulota bacterium]|nr:YifB family Mg chelatase-like AAA ATPase [Candidatus Bipolaricaulota bacterium]
MFARLLSGVVLGIEARLIEIQCDVSGGLPTFNMVGLPEKEVSESRERIRSAIKNSKFNFPAGRITANLAPADLKKEGVGFDLPIAIAILTATGQVNNRAERYLLLGELALNGEVRGIRGVLPIALETAKHVDGFIVPRANVLEAAIATDKPVYPVETLAEAQRFLNCEIEIAPVTVDRETLTCSEQKTFRHNLTEVRGQLQAKRALEIAAAGGHNLLMIGPPGSGKSLLARCMPDLLPPLSFEEALEVTRIYSTAGMLEPGESLVWRRPYRAPHHTISYAGMVGGGHGIPGPGEISLAHHGVLFLDELPEFDRRVLETLRQPLEDRSILISRAGISVRYPSAFTLVAAMNPCPCGFLGDPVHSCTCSLHDVRRYKKRLSGPFLDRMDLCVEVPRVPAEELFGAHIAEASELVHQRVAAAREIQWERMRDDEDCHSNSQLDGERLDAYCALENDAQQLLRRAVDRFGLSARAHSRIRRVARTIADLANSQTIRPEHIAEAIQLRTTGDVVADF